LIDAIRKTEAKGAAAMALLYLSEQADENDSIQISTRKVAEAIGYSPSTTRDAMTCLLDLGEIELQKPGQRGRAAHYIVCNRIDAHAPQKEAQNFRQIEVENAKVDRKPVQVESKPQSSPGVRSAFRATVSTCGGFLEWAKAASRNDVCIYHIGMIAIDRTQSRELDALAGLVSILVETGYITPGQHTITLAAGRQVAYTAARSGSGYAPRAIINGHANANEYRALRAIEARAADQSAARALRDNLAISDDAANAQLRKLHTAEYIVRGRNLAWVLTDRARKLLA